MGTIINSLAIILGGLAGLCFGKFLKENVQETLTSACGISVLFLGISGAMEGMLKIEDSSLISQNGMMVVISLALGALIGSFLDIEQKFEDFGAWLKIKTGNAKDKRFIDGFVNASLTVCIGAMAIVGAIEDGLTGDSSILVTKAILDFIIIMVMSASLGKGTIFSALPVLMFQGSITLLARIIEPVMTIEALFYLSLVGNILIFCVGLNLVWGKKVKVANLLPAVILAILLSGCSAEKIHSNQQVVIDDTKIEFPVSVTDFCETFDIDLSDETKQTIVKSKLALPYECGSFGIIVYNDTPDPMMFSDAAVTGIVQSMEHIHQGAKAIVFPENLKVGDKITSEELVSLITKSGDICEDARVIQDKETGIEAVVAGKRSIHLALDWQYQIEEAVFPVEVLLDDGVITEIRMIFVDTK